MLEINEIFGPTIQGEGKKVGTPSVFIRFGKCNMQCIGFDVEYETPSGMKKCSCDSFYASDIAFRDSWKKYAKASDLIKDVAKLLPKYKCDIVITGGEPLLYWDDEQFQELLKYYLQNNFNITIETNGSLDIDLQPWHKDILFSISVKLSNSKEPLSKRVNISALNKILNISKYNYLKFVIDKNFLPLAQQEIKDITNQITKSDIYIMPLGDTSDKIDTNSLPIVNFALDNGYIYSDRLHIRLWDNSRGK